MTGRTHTVRALVLLLAVILIGAGLAGPAAAAHGAPVVTSPTDGSTVCVPEGEAAASIPVAGTTIPNAPVAVRHSGAPLANGTADGSGAFSVPTDLDAGVHELDAVATDPSEPAHDSDPSAPVTVTVVDPNGALGNITRTVSVISPRNVDGYLDSVVFGVPVLESGTVRFEVRQGATLIRASAPKLVTAGANHTWLWKGKTASNAWVASGTYTVVAVWQQSGCAIESNTTKIKIDNWAPTISAIAVSASKFYPARNDAYTSYKDTVTVKYSGLKETAHVSLYVFRRGSSVPVRKYSLGWKSASPSFGSFVWNGRAANGSLLPEGTYDLAWRLMDGARNVRFSARKAVTISHWHVVARTATIRTNGNAYLRQSEGGCGVVAPGASDWAEGVWLVTQNCVVDDIDGDFAGVEYNFGLPNAVVYRQARVGVYGYTLFGTPLYGSVLDTSGDPDLMGGALVSGQPATQWFSSFNLSGRVTSQRRVLVRLESYSACDCHPFTDYDIRWVYLRVTYGALAPQ